MGQPRPRQLLTGRLAYLAGWQATLRWVLLFVGLVLAAWALWQLEGHRPDAEVTRGSVGTTPVTEWRVEEPIATVVVAHGFAGSRPLMNAFSWTLAGAGYNVTAFDFEGHGTNPVPMQGDVNEIEGVTARLVAETRAVMDAAGPAPALLGHSMATDVLIRAAEGRETGPVVAISAFSGAVTPTHPPNMLLIAGEWEGRLIDFGREAIRQVDAAATEGEVVGGRMALIAPNVEHVGILFAPFTLRETLDWLDDFYGVERATPALATIGYPVLVLLAALMVLWRPIAALLPEGEEAAAAVPRKALLWCAVFQLLTPVAVYWIELGVLPVLVADYLALHLGFAGLMQLLILRHFGVRFGRLAYLPAAALLAWGLGVFGLAIDTYLANFHPNAERALILAALALGAVPYMVADAVATQGGRGPLWHRLFLRTAFFASLGLAIALDFERLFFLFLIAPVILLFFLIFGMMGRWTADRAGPLAPGVALGLILAWSLGVTFPLFEA
ncbi:MAG: alpha/beta hydrolase [Pseudomonadota bacterium]